MRDHGYEIDREAAPARIAFAPVFNVAVPFIDRHVPEGRGDRIAFRTVHEDVSYAALAERVNRCGNALLGLGIVAGDRVLMVVKDCPDFVYLFWGAIKAGIVPVPLNTLLRHADYQIMIEDSGCAALAYSPEYEAEVSHALATAAHKPTHVLCIDGRADGIPALMAAAGTALDPAPTASGDDCFWLYSSGSTGRPKGVVHAHRDMVVTSQLFGVDVLGAGAGDVSFSAAKLFFAYGLGNAMTVPLWTGGQAILSEARPTPEMTFALIERFRPTLYYGVPTLYTAQLRALERADPDLSSLRICFSAGEPLPPDIFRRWRDRTGLAILDGIGSTEALHVFIGNRPGDARPGTSGRLVPGYEARIVDEQGRETAPGEAGHLMVKGDSVAGYYWGDPERTAAALVDGWLRTGDTYDRDADGYFYYRGRSDDMMKVGGIWCSPIEIEARLIEHPQVLEAAVVGRADGDGLVKPAAFVVLNEPSDASDALADELRAFCKDGLARYKYPRWFHFAAELPKTATGKIQRYRLREG